MPFESAGCCELAISDKFDLKKLPVIKKLGYHTIAIERTIDDSAFESKKYTKKGENVNNVDPVPEPVKIPEGLADGLTILHRLTLQFSDSGIVHKFNQAENTKKYDILSIVPKSLAAFQYACSSMDVDIISYRPECSNIFKINRKIYRQGVDRGIHFELVYSPALKDSNYRMSFIQQAHVYNSVGKSKNMLISSGAENEFQVRGAYDVINLGLILALSEEQTKNLLTENTRRVLLKADGRRRGKVSVFVMQKINSKKRQLSDAFDKNKKLKLS